MLEALLDKRHLMVPSFICIYGGKQHTTTTLEKYLQMKFLKKLFYKFLIFFRGSFKSRVLRCNERNNAECACGKVVSINKKRRRKDFLEDEIFLDIHSSDMWLNKIDQEIYNITSTVGFSVVPDEIIKNFSIVLILRNMSGSVILFQSLTEQEAQQKFQEILNEKFLYIEILKDNNTLTSFFNPDVKLIQC